MSEMGGKCSLTHVAALDHLEGALMGEVHIWIGDDDGHSALGVCRIILGPKKGLRRVRIRIERPKHFNDQSIVGQPYHGHVEERRGGDWVEVQVLNPDGTGSHGTKAGDAIRSDVADALREYGWNISEDNLVQMMPEAINRFIVAALDLLRPEAAHLIIELIIPLRDSGE